MRRWEYIEVLLRWDRERKKWVSPEQADRSFELVGTSEVYAHYGDAGWELVGVHAGTYEAFGETNRRLPGSPESTTFVSRWSMTSRIYYFKRSREE